jgi:hypothetical protein
MYASARKPSNFTSYSQSPARGSDGASVASIGLYRRPGSAGAFSSWLRMISQFCSLPSRCAGTSVQVPSSRLPCRRTFSWPFGFSSSSSYVPLSQISTEPAPYWPAGISPWNFAYSSGWSSTCTASARSPGSSGTPFGTAHDASTPSRSSRKS